MGSPTPTFEVGVASGNGSRGLQYERFGREKTKTAGAASGVAGLMRRMTRKDGEV